MKKKRNIFAEYMINSSMRRNVHEKPSLTNSCKKANLTTSPAKKSYVKG